MQERVYIVRTPVRDTSRCNQRLEAASHWHTGMSQNVIYKAVGQWRKQLRASMKEKWHHWTSAKLKPALFRANTLHNRLFSEPPTVYWGKHVVSRHFRRSCLKANKASRSEVIRKVKYAYNLLKCVVWCCWLEIIKISPCLSKPQLGKVGAFFETQCRRKINQLDGTYKIRRSNVRVFLSVFNFKRTFQVGTFKLNHNNNVNVIKHENIRQKIQQACHAFPRICTFWSSLNDVAMRSAPKANCAALCLVLGEPPWRNK